MSDLMECLVASSDKKTADLIMHAWSEGEVELGFRKEDGLKVYIRCTEIYKESNIRTYTGGLYPTSRDNTVDTVLTGYMFSVCGKESGWFTLDKKIIESAFIRESATMPEGARYAQILRFAKRLKFVMDNCVVDKYENCTPAIIKRRNEEDAEERARQYQERKDAESRRVAKEQMAEHERNAKNKMPIDVFLVWAVPVALVFICASFL